MRISVDQTDRGFSPLWMKAKVTLNGKELKGCCITADEETGIALCYETDASGKLISDGDHIRTVTLIGDVKIIIPDEHHSRLGA